MVMFFFRALQIGLPLPDDDPIILKYDENAELLKFKIKFYQIFIKFLPTFFLFFISIHQFVFISV